MNNRKTDRISIRHALLAGALLLPLVLGGCAQFWKGFRGSTPEWDSPSFRTTGTSRSGGSAGAGGANIKTRVSK